MIKLIIGKTYNHRYRPEQIVISDIKRGQGMKPTMVYFGDQSLPANEFKHTYQHAHTGAPKW